MSSASIFKTASVDVSYNTHGQAGVAGADLLLWDDDLGTGGVVGAGDGVT